MALNRKLCVPHLGHCEGPGLDTLGFLLRQLSHTHSTPFSGPQFPQVQSVGLKCPT